LTRTALGGTAVAITYEVVCGEDTTIASLIRVFSLSSRRGNSIQVSLQIAYMAWGAKVKLTSEAEVARVLQFEVDAVKAYEIHSKAVRMNRKPSNIKITRRLIR